MTADSRERHTKLAQPGGKPVTPAVPRIELARLREAMQLLAEEIGALRQDLRVALSPRAKAKPFYTVTELAEQFGRSPYTIRRWIRAGKIDAVKLNSGGPRDQYLIAHDDVAELIAQAETKERVLVSRAGGGCPRSSSLGKGAGSGGASPRSDAPYSGR